MLAKGLVYSLPGTCLLALQPRTTYVLTGHVEAAKPWTNLCHFAQPLRSLQPKMRKGFRMLYHSGCDCPVRRRGILTTWGSQWGKPYGVDGISVFVKTDDPFVFKLSGYGL